MSAVDETRVGERLSIQARVLAEQRRSAIYRRQWKRKEARQRRQRERVYFIQCEHFLKIGYSCSPHRRLDALKTANPFPCKILGSIRGGSILESELHTVFAQHRHVGEWFHLTPDLRAKIEEILAKGGFSP